MVQLSTDLGWYEHEESGTNTMTYALLSGEWGVKLQLNSSLNAINT